MTSLTTCLWFDTRGREAAELYVSVFPRSRILSTVPYPPGTERAGQDMLVTFELDGARFQALNGGPDFTFSEAVSIVATVETQEELDRVWDALTADGGREVECGWVTDRYGLSWQVVPALLERISPEDEPERYARVMTAVLGMVKLDIAALEAAADGVPA
jgi:predicted 3-demethylubiquinone-9 3-methyltransferase (glyoxalase superfamily)